jgi:hypothetical protein
LNIKNPPIAAPTAMRLGLPRTDCRNRLTSRRCECDTLAPALRDRFHASAWPERTRRNTNEWATKRGIRSLFRESKRKACANDILNKYRHLQRMMVAWPAAMARTLVDKRVASRACGPECAQRAPANAEV